MSKVFNFSGDDAFCPGGALYPSPKESSLFLSLGHHVDVYFPPCKRSRVTAPIIFTEKQKKLPSIDVLPDECLFEVLRRVSDGKERSACACVSKRWLMLLSSIRGYETVVSKPSPSSETEERSIQSAPVKPVDSIKKGEVVDPNGVEVADIETQDIEGEGHLSRCLDGKKATDVRLAAIAVGTATHGGLGKLSIRGSNPSRGVTDTGLKAIARGCPSLRALSLWNVSSVSDEGLSEIAQGCHLLEKLDLCQCPAITDASLVAIAKSCPNLTSLTIESCANIGNESLQAVGRFCPKLKFVSLKNCPLIGDQGIASLFSSAGHVLTKVKLHALNISDVSLAVIGHYGIAVTDIALIGLQSINERGFWVMGNGQGLQKLRSLAITACSGVTDLGLEALGKGCPNLKLFCLRKCAFLSDNGLVAFAKGSASLENLQLEECHRITQAGLFGVLLSCGKKLKALSLVNCFGVKELACRFPSVLPCNSLQSLSIRNCPGVGNATLAVAGRLCPKLTHLELSGLVGITDEGLFPLVQSCEAGLVKVNLSGCVNVTDKSVSAITELHGGSLEFLNVDGCKYVTDATLVAISNNCWLLSELDLSKCGITDSGIASLAGAVQLNLQILSLSGCSMLSNKSLPFLQKLGQTLMGLNIQHCNGISSSAVDLLLEQLWRCDILA
ncbi:EIN3-binding F-box protein 1 [Nicotiana sylvestris]|uniref:EIN3-binding F-box protein 1 n=1 Tax=Nicotiana sylvestris TaxID=4096 RepID=A0A1U7YGJ9_NICSY|nr:PREDICTED: EIN3-binding F-box protein 1 [Nicotiana sylvestris]